MFLDLKPADWPALSALMDEAMELPVGERERWAAALPLPAGPMREAFERWLDDLAEVETGDFLQTPAAAERANATAVPPPTSPAGERLLGPYRLLEEIGHGGMASVWLAERSDGRLKRRVALKLPHAGLVRRLFDERLERERDILGALEHPNIARLYDAGVSAAGQAFLALEYVEGEPITAYCDGHRLDLRQRIALLMQVLSAVQYAHQALVVHRDLKPSNILVTPQGETRLLDFGIAKLLIDGQTRETELTQIGGRPMTPDYASPEQIAGRAVGTPSDVYSLGVLLYELLCGARPYVLRRDSRGALEDAILEHEPGPPSRRTITADAAARRASTPQRLARSLAGDLDTIALKALKKDSAARYPTADAFRQDLQRHLDGQPVLARPDSRLYRAGKFVRRHTLALGTAAALALAVVGGAAATAWQANEARAQAQRAQAVQDFLTGMFNEAEPARAGGRELSARELLDRGQRDLQTKLAGQPRLNAELDGVLAQLYVKLNDEQKALPLALARCDATLALDGAQSLSYGDALASLARVQSGLLRHELAYETYGRARDVLQRHARVRQGELLTIDAHRAFELSEMQRNREAAELLDALLPKLASHFGPHSWEFIQRKALLSNVHGWLGERERSLAETREVEPLLDTVDPAHAVEAIYARNSMGIARLAAWQPDEAARLLRRALEDWERLVGTHTGVAVNIERTLALALGEVGQFEAAAMVSLDNVKRAVLVAGEDNPATTLSESFGVRALIMVGRVADAEDMARRSIMADSRSSAPASMRSRDFGNRLGLALLYDGKAGEAGRLLEESAERARHSGAAQGDVYGRTLHYLAGARVAEGRFEAAVQASEQAVEVFSHSPIGADMYVARAQLTEAIALARSGQAAHAMQLIDRADEHLQKVCKADHPTQLFARLVRAEALRAGGHAAEAGRVDREAREKLMAGGAVLPRALPMIF